MGPCSETFGGVYGNIDIFFNMAECLGLARSSNATGTLGGGSGGASPVKSGAVPRNSVQRGLLAGMMGLMGAIWWGVVNM